MIYVSGPNSQQLFQQSLKTLHFAVPTFSAPSTNQTETATVTEPTTTPESETVPESATEAAPTSTTSAPLIGGLPQIDYIRAEVLPPHTRIVVGELPLFAYSFLPHALQPNFPVVPAAKTNEPLNNGSTTTSTTEVPAVSKEETDSEKSEPSTTLTPNSEESESYSSSDSNSDSSSNDNDNQNNKNENSTEETESATETSENTDS